LSVTLSRLNPAYAVSSATTHRNAFASCVLKKLEGALISARRRLPFETRAQWLTFCSVYVLKDNLPHSKNAPTELIFFDVEHCCDLLIVSLVGSRKGRRIHDKSSGDFTSLLNTVSVYKALAIPEVIYDSPIMR